MTFKDIWTVELNLDADSYLDNHSWHIDKLDNLITSNSHAFNNRNDLEHWLLLSVNNNYEDALESVHRYKRILISMKDDNGNSKI